MTFRSCPSFFFKKKYSVRMRRSTYFSENGKKKLTRIQRLAEWQKKCYVIDWNKNTKR